MHDSESTLTSPRLQRITTGLTTLAATVLWHPDLSRIGQQAFCPTRDGAWMLQRFSPDFRAAGAATGSPLGLQVISRQGLQVTLDDAGAVTLSSPQDRMRIEVDGQALAGACVLTPERLRRGVVLGLGGTVLLCLHWAQGLPRMNDLGGLVGISSAMIRVREQILQVAPTSLPVLLLAESGSGKELAAHAIHRFSRVAAHPFIAVNMAALGEHTAAADLFGVHRGAYTGAQANRQGLFAEAGQGSLFMDEVGDTPPPIQPMLLRVLESGEYRPLGASRHERSQARIIAASDRALAHDGFNQPLLRRLEAFTLRLPPLRERREDIGLLLMHLLPEPKAELAARLGWDFLTAAFLDDWPGNVRQLGHAVRRAALQIQMGEEPDGEPVRSILAPSDVAPLPPRIAPEAAPAVRRIAPAALSDDQVVAALDRHGWCIQRTARALSISRPSLYALISRNGAIRDPADVPELELRAACFEGEGSKGRTRPLEACASTLRVPKQALRRRLRSLGLLPGPGTTPSQRE